MGTKVHARYPSSRGGGGWGHRIGQRRGGAGVGSPALLFTQGTVGLLRQAREGFGLAGACALGLDGTVGVLVAPLGELGQR